MKTLCFELLHELYTVIPIHDDGMRMSIRTPCPPPTRQRTCRRRRHHHHQNHNHLELGNHVLSATA